MDLSKEARLHEFYSRLRDAPASGTRDEAFRLLEEMLNEVEDELTAIPFDPTNWQNDGRLYPPQKDSMRDVQDHPTVKRFRTRGHNSFIGANGAIEIQRVGGAVEFTKVGRDGKGLWE
ncbi:MAG: hypothetical protein V3S98_01490 [Dehalococcoidia bacterium]